MELSVDRANDQSEGLGAERMEEAPSLTTASPQSTRAVIAPQCGCLTCSGSAANGTVIPSYVYAIGTIERRFPRLSIEKEFAQVIGRIDAKGLTDLQALHKVLSLRENRYLARQVCWVMTIEGLETYILVPRDPADYELLIESVRAIPNPSDIDVIVGMKGPIAPAELCNGLLVPIVVIDQLYSFDRESLVKAIPRPEKTPVKEFTATAEELFDKIQQMADNAGASDEHRALNYLAVRYPAIYAATADAHARNSSLTSLNAVPSRLSGTRKIVDVVLTYTNRVTDVQEKHFVRVDVTEEFPFLVTKLSPYYDR
jgi:hypothetical protein